MISFHLVRGEHGDLDNQDRVSGSVTTDKVEAGEKKVRFKPFIGVGPRVFFDLFSLSLSDGRPIERENKATGYVTRWEPKGAIPRVQMLPFAHRRFEQAAIEYIRNLTGSRGST